MKQIALFFGLIALMLINLKCLKEEIDSSKTTQVATVIDSTELITADRNGIRDVIFYRTSLTSDNYLLVSSPNNKPRTHVIYNKKKVKNIEFKNTPNGLANINGVLMKHYALKINYTNNTFDTLSAFSKSSSNSFTFTPSGDNMLIDTHLGNKITIESTNRKVGLQIYNFWRNSKTQMDLWNIYIDNTFVQQRYLEPINKNSTQFTPVHIH